MKKVNMSYVPYVDLKHDIVKVVNKYVNANVRHAILMSAGHSSQPADFGLFLSELSSAILNYINVED